MKSVFSFVFLFLCCSVQAQTILENNPPSIRWYQVQTPHFNVLFPEGFNFQAQRVASTLEHIRTAEANSMGKAPRKISIILQNQSSISNGFVSLFPRRSEFYTMPSQNYNFLGNNDWLDLLASHEYRHIVQYQHANRGFNKLVFLLFGYPTLAGLAHAGAPDWFWEGDAVVTETAFTPGGRGRIPNFNLVFRTNLLEGRTFNYHKQYLRSYKHHIPDHYVLGYNMVSYLRRKTNDADIWEKITARSWSVPFIPFAFSNAIRKETGMGVSKLYRTMVKDLQQDWQAQIDSLKLTSFEKISSRKNTAYTDYLYPQPQQDGSVLVQKEGIGDIQQFVLLESGKEEKIFTPGFMNDSGMLSATDRVVVWNEYGFDPRWQVRNFSLIKAFDRSTNSVVVVSHKNSRFGSASISPDQGKVVTVRTGEDYLHTMVVLEYPSGAILKEYDNPQNHFYSMPRWSDDGKSIVVLKTSKGGKSITMLDYASGKETDVLPVSEENVGYPVVYKDFVLFNSPATGIDNIYAVNLSTGKRYQVTTSRYGAYNPAVDVNGSFLYYNDQSRNGMDVVRIPFQPGSWQEVQEVKIENGYADVLTEQEGNPGLFKDIPQGSYPVTKYSRWKNIINPFSWGLFVENDLTTVDVGITSRDILSTTNITAGYTLDLNERTGYWRAGLSYQGLFPIIDVNFTQGERSVNEGTARTLIINGTDTTRTLNDIVFKWKEQNVSAGFRLPLVTTRSRYSSGVTLLNYFGLTRIRDFSNLFTRERFFPTVIKDGEIVQGFSFPEYVGNGTLYYNYMNVTASRFLKRSARDIYSRWGQSLDISYYSTPYGGDYSGGLFSALAALYFPGIGKHHSINGYVAVQEMLNETQLTRGDYWFRNTVPVPRGQSVGRFKRFYSASLNYTLPLWYPDIALGPVLNIQRVRFNGFADYALGQTRFYNLSKQSYLSVGGEIMFDLNLMRFLPQLDIGLRYTYGVSPSVTEVELVLGTFNF